MRPLGGMCGKDDPRTPVNRVCLSGITWIPPYENEKAGQMDCPAV